MARRFNWVDEVERDELWCFNSSAFHSADPESPSTELEHPTELEKLCLEQFGLNLRELRSRFRLLSKDLQSALHAFCTVIHHTPDAARRRELAQSFMEGIAHITKLATDQSMSTLAQMQSTFLERMEKENDLLRSQLAASEEKATHFQRAWQKSEAAKETIEADAHERFEQEKAVLEVSMREELHACQICEVNPRNVVIMPCFHGQYCAQCVEGHKRTSNTCPACRGTIRGTMPYIA